MSSEIFKGRVLDVDQHPIKNVNAEFILDDKTIGSVSDDDGIFLISNLAPGNYMLKVSHIGYQPYSQKVSIPKEMFSMKAKFSSWLCHRLRVAAERS